MPKQDVGDDDATTSTNLRVPNWLMDRVRHSAVANGRSLNAEIIQTLKERLNETCGLSHIPNAETLAAIREIQSPDFMKRAIRAPNAKTMINKLLND